MAMSLTRGLSPEAVWDLLHASVDDPLSIGQLVKDATRRRLNFFDEFNYTVLDAEIWTEGGDAGGQFAIRDNGDRPTSWFLQTGALLNDDYYIHGGTNVQNKVFTPLEINVDTVDWQARLRLAGIVTVSTFWGLFNGAPIVDYAEPVVRCAHFFFDPVVSANIQARSYRIAEEQTDTLVAGDADPHDYRIVWTAASVLFYIDDVLVATHAVQVPDRVMWTEFLVRTEAAAARYMDIDSNYVEVY